MELLLRKYARLLLTVGINLQKGQKIFLVLESCHREFAVIFTEEAYKLGAGFVLVELSDPFQLAARVNFSQSEYLDYLPSWTDQRNQSMIEEKWARVALFGPSEPTLMGTLDQERLSKVQAMQRKSARALSRAAGAGEIAWTVAALPTPKWASSVFVHETENKAMELLWQQLIKILHLEDEDPSQVWRDISEGIIHRGKILEQLNVAQLHFKSAQTDLTIACFKDSVWQGGSCSCRGEYVFLPNIPTFENFTTPDFRGTEGYAKATRPTEIMGTQVVGARFEFKQGKVVKFSADQNEEVLAQMFAMCPQSFYLGEVALVDNSSPIYQSGRVFSSVLFDENACCHIALGSGYVSAAPDTSGKSEDELLAMGCNVSLVHHDFMIGSDDLDVDALTNTGERISLLKAGRYTSVFA
jgi:aminopeptidase